MSKASHCQKCGATFTWWWRWRHICARCNTVVCDTCSENMVHTPERVRNLNFEKEELCNDCDSINAKELEKDKLVDVITTYERSYEYGLERGRGRILPPKADEFFWDIEKRPHPELVRLATDKGYHMGFEEGKRREEEERRHRKIREAVAKQVQEELQRKEADKSRRQTGITQSQKRKCSICGETGHDARNCNYREK